MSNKKQWTTTIIILAVIVALNLVASLVFFRLDFTENGKYSISKVTKEILNSIEDPITVKIYYSEKFPRQLVAVKQYVMDMLEEYRAYAHGGLDYEFIEISGEDREKEQEALGYGVQPVQANITESDQIKVQRIFLGLVFLYGDKKEVIPFANQLDQLEYDMTGAIKKLISENPPKIGWLTGHGEPELWGNQGISRPLAEIRKNYTLQAVNLTASEKVPDDINVLLMVNPTDSFKTEELYKLDQFLMRGGHLGVFFNHKKIDLTNQFVPVQTVHTNLDPFFKHFGFEIDNRLLMDAQAYQVQALQNLGFIQMKVLVDYPFAPRMTDLNRESPIVNRLDEVGFFFVSQVNAAVDTTKTDSIEFIPLIKTSPHTAYAKADPRTHSVDINPGKKYGINFFREGPKTVAALIKGNFKSYFGDKRPESINYPDPHLSTSQAPVEIVAVGNGNFLEAQFRVPSALTFFLNSIDWLYDEHGLISIRSKNINPPQLEETTPATRALIKWLNILLAPIILITFGIIRWVIRRRAKKLVGGLAA